MLRLYYLNRFYILKGKFNVTILFYVSGFSAILFTVCVIFNNNPIYALFCLIISLLSVACNLFCLGASFAGALEIIVYAGAIMVFFVFVIMMFNMKNICLYSEDMEYSFLPLKMCLGVVLLMSSLLIILLFGLFEMKDCFINIFESSSISLKKIGTTLFGPYVLVVEMASFLLLSALISVLHIIQFRDVSIHSDFKQSQKY